MMGALRGLFSLLEQQLGVAAEIAATLAAIEQIARFVAWLRDRFGGPEPTAA
jgi:hypothetical protein